MQKIKWVKPSGVVVETNGEPASIEAAINLGWVLESEAKEEQDKPRRGRPPKDKGE
jgi:hypothetical protein